MGVVYEADEPALGRRVALKVVSPQYAGDPDFRTRFSNEARAQAALDSAHVVSIFAHGEIDGSLYIASQLVPDGDLSHLMRTHGAPPPAVAVDLIAQVASLRACSASRSCFTSSGSSSRSAVIPKSPTATGGGTTTASRR
jgi:serine/threonine-protein kinase